MFKQQLSVRQQLSRRQRRQGRPYPPAKPEQVRHFADTWRDGIKRYLTYLGIALTVAAIC